MLSDKVFQMFIAGTGAKLDYALKQGLGGVIFFKDDIRSAEQFKALISDIKTKSKTPPFLSIDQEGGRVERTENIHPKAYLSPKYAYQKGEEFLTYQTAKMLTEIKSYGINMNFAPCLDVNSNPDNPIIGERAFSDKTNEVCNGFDIVLPVYERYNIIPVVKHFPGHGDTSVDSHKTLPAIDIPMHDMEKIHIQPFRHAVERGAEIVMVAHLWCKCFDEKEIPTSLSKNCINYLRKDLNFNGVAISDDMYMKGVAKYGMSEAAIMGIRAGLNMFIYRDMSEETLSVIEDVIKHAEKDEELKTKINTSYEKICELKKAHNLM